MTDKQFIKEIRNWRKNHNDLRLGQYLWNIMAMDSRWEAPEANALFFIEDNELADLLERYERKTT